MEQKPPKKDGVSSTVARLKMLPPIPKKVKCKFCETLFDNPIRLGSGVVIVTCDKCRKDLKKASLARLERRVQDA